MRRKFGIFQVPDYLCRGLQALSVDFELGLVGSSPIHPSAWCPWADEGDAA